MSTEAVIRIQSEIDAIIARVRGLEFLNQRLKRELVGVINDCDALHDRLKGEAESNSAFLGAAEQVGQLVDSLRGRLAGLTGARH